MDEDGYIPAATVAKLAEPTPKGHRHGAAMDIAVSLIGNGLPETAVYATLRSKFPEDVTDKELHDVVRWAASKKPTPSGFGDRAQRQTYVSPPSAIASVKSPIEMVEWWTSGARLDEDQLCSMSPVGIPAHRESAAALAVSSLYRDTENLNVVCKFILDKDDPNKARPYGAGKTMTSARWAEYFQRRGVPQSEAGAWVRINPCAATGTGKDGAVTDSDITAYRYCLVESDSLPLPMQLAFYSRAPIPVAAIWTSGGSSAHAIVRLDADSDNDFSQLVKGLLAVLGKFGIDPANKNPSRLSRLPGATRTIGASNGGEQRLIWLNPSVPALSMDGIKRLKEALLFPAIEEKPLRAIAQRALERYNSMRQNVGRLGIPIGIPEFDIENGGVKAGQTIVVAGKTGGGKSTFAMHIIRSAIDAGHGVLLFSLEMDQDEIFDLMVSEKAYVNRNKFNSGRFSEHDVDLISHAVGKLQNIPLFIEDSALASVEQIRLRTLQLKASGKVALVVVDYVQFINAGLSRETREQQVAAISHSLRALARETKLPFIILSQLNDEGKLRESRVIAHNANAVLMVEDAGKVFKVKVVKGRGIPEGQFELEYQRMFARLVAPRYNPEVIAQEDIPLRQTHPDA